MSERLIKGTASERGRRVFVHPGNSAMKRVSYGRIRLDSAQKQVAFVNEDEETGLICVKGSGVIVVGDRRFNMKPDDALYVPKGLATTVETATELDLVECFAPVDGKYPSQFVSAESVR